MSGRLASPRWHYVALVWFWTKVTQDRRRRARSGRDFAKRHAGVGLPTMKLVIWLNLTEGALPQSLYTVDPRLVSAKGQAYIAGVLTVAVVQQVEI